MPITFSCPSCQSRMTVPDNMAGKRGKCSKCKGPVVVPGPLPGLQAVPAQAQAAPATVRVVVPANAEVWLDREKTNQTGMERAFVLPPLAPGKLHVVNVRASWVANGQVVEQFRVVGIKAGETAKVNFLEQR